MVRGSGKKKSVTPTDTGKKREKINLIISIVENAI